MRQTKENKEAYSRGIEIILRAENRIEEDAFLDSVEGLQGIEFYCTAKKKDHYPPLIIKHVTETKYSKMKRK